MRLFTSVVSWVIGQMDASLLARGSNLQVTARTFPQLSAACSGRRYGHANTSDNRPYREGSLSRVVDDEGCCLLVGELVCLL